MPRVSHKRVVMVDSASASSDDGNMPRLHSRNDPANYDADGHFLHPFLRSWGFHTWAEVLAMREGSGANIKDKRVQETFNFCGSDETEKMSIWLRPLLRVKRRQSVPH